MNINSIKYVNNLKNVVLKSIFLFLLVLSSTNLFATHNRAGEITYKQIGPLTIEMTITTYTKTSSSAADRDSLEVFWGDGTSQVVVRIGNGTTLDNDVKKNQYTAEHTYPGRSTYTIYFEDPNRVGNILNVNYPNSIDVPFFLSTTFTLLNPQFQGYNNSAILLQPPIDVACVGRPFVHNPNAYDVDGDSLAYELVTPLMSKGEPVPNYKFPGEILPSLNNLASINAVTGDFRWVSPPQLGEYNIAILIKEYRKGVLINSIIRDMQIKIVSCDNEPPTIKTEREICVIAGELLEIPVVVDDPDVFQKVRLTATGGPFTVSADKATIANTNAYLDPTINTTFKWQTNCNHVSKEYYQVVFKAIDNYFGDSTGLATFHTLRIKVVAPPPDTLEAEATNGEITLTWALPYACETTDNYFQGFSIWRKISPNPFKIDSCSTGLDGKGYQEIVFITKQNDGDKYFYIDSNLDKATTYCYRVQAEFSLLTPSGSFYNRVESLPSNEVCEQISRDLPLLTKVSVDETSANQGEIHIRWTKPIVSQLDTLENPGPYKIELSKSLLGQLNYQVIPSSVINFNSFTETIDTNFIDSGLNTLGNQLDYKLLFYTGKSAVIPYGESSTASSIFVNTTTSDRRITLSWSDDTPWSNYTYDVLKQQSDGTFSVVSTTSNTTFSDVGLTNDTEYCYYIKATGTYSLQGIEDPIVNSSQIVCARPIDNVPPCPPKITVKNICTELDDFSTIDELINTVRWTDPNIFCENKELISKYTLYFSNTLDGDFMELTTRTPNEPLIYDHKSSNNSLAGCYAVTATDQLGNESQYSEIICIENCPLYELPNTFTPNDDGANDIFRPIKNLFISRVEFNVFNEWGNLVFATTDPALNWDGKKDTTGKELHPATYYYVCSVYSLSAEGEVEILPALKGFIQLIR